MIMAEVYIIQNIVASTKVWLLLGRPIKRINLDTLVQKNPAFDYNPESYHGAILKKTKEATKIVPKHKVSVIIHSSGNIMMVGCKSEEEIKLEFGLLKIILQDCCGDDSDGSVRPSTEDDSGA